MKSSLQHPTTHHSTIKFISLFWEHRHFLMAFLPASSRSLFSVHRLAKRPGGEGIQNGSLWACFFQNEKSTPPIILNRNIYTVFLAFSKKLWSIFFKSQHTFFLKDGTTAHVLLTFDTCWSHTDGQNYNTCYFRHFSHLTVGGTELVLFQPK